MKKEVIFSQRKYGQGPGFGNAQGSMTSHWLEDSHGPQEPGSGDHRLAESLPAG